MQVVGDGNNPDGGVFNVDGIADPFAGSICTRSCSTTRRSTLTGPARRPVAAAPRMRGRATRTAGSSGSINLKAYAGKSVEISIAYVSD
jgi:hypothetical protein